MFGASSGKLPSVMRHSFSQVPKAEIQRSSFNRSHGFKTTLDAGKLVPIFIDEALPGDTFTLNTSLFARLGTPITPVMDNLYADVFFFCIPLRLVWNNFQKFMGEQTDPDDSTDYLVPQMTPPVAGYTVGSLSDYFGIPTGVGNTSSTTWSHSSLFHRSYNLVYNEWFRDQNLQDSVVVDKDDGPDLDTDYVVLNRGKRHDYFTSCLPWPQKGPAVDLPLGTSAPVLGIGKSNQTYAQDGQVVYESDGTTSTYASGTEINPGNADRLFYVEENGSTGYPNIRADLSNATAATINSLRQAFQIQRMLEKDARGGTRYTEVIRAHFGVTSPDARLQRPEYLGGGSRPITFSPIPQTSSTDATTPQGNLAAMAQFSTSGLGFKKSFTEHCIVMGLISIRADLNYQQGLNRMFSRQTRYDFYWPALAHLGEQSVLNQEIYLQNSAPQNETVFGYQERFAEYRYKPSLITGKFRSSASGTLDVWHLAQNFSSLPELDEVFIQDDPPVDRILATADSEPHCLLDAHFDLNCIRPMPTYSVPGLIDHF